MQFAASTDRDRIGWGTVLSLALHAALLVVLLQIPPQPPTGRFDEGIPVEVWTPHDFDAVSGAKGPTPSDVNPPASQPAPAPAEAASAAPAVDRDLPPPPPAEPHEAGGADMIHASRMLSGTVLADPRSRQALATLSSLDDETRAEQLCGIEAMAQIALSRSRYRPDQVVAYAMAEVKTEGGLLQADGAAFRSNHHWFALRFRCSLSSDRRSISDFAYAIGPAIPRRDWEAHGLAPLY